MSSRAGAGTVARRRAVIFPVGAGVVILALPMVFAIELSSAQARSRSAVTDRVHEGSVLAGALIDSLVQRAWLTRSRRTG